MKWEGQSYILQLRNIVRHYHVDLFKMLKWGPALPTFAFQQNGKIIDGDCWTFIKISLL